VGNCLIVQNATIADYEKAVLQEINGHYSTTNARHINMTVSMLSTTQKLGTQSA